MSQQLSEKFYNIAMSKVKLVNYQGALADFDEAISHRVYQRARRRPYKSEQGIRRAS